MALPEAKPDTKIRMNYRTAALDSQARPALSTSLPMYVTDSLSSSLYQVYSPPRPDPADVLTMIGGVIKRFCYNPPPLNRTEKRKLIRFVDSWLRHPSSGMTPLTNEEIPSFDEWIENAPYSEARKRELKHVWNSCSRLPQWRKWKIVKSFIKDETYSEYKYPRLINSRVDTAKCFWGPYVEAVSKKLFANPWFIKNTPVAERPQVLRDALFKPGQKYIFTDYTAFEAHFTPEIMSMLQARLFSHLFKYTEHLDSVERFNKDILAGTNVCQFKFMSVKIPGVRMSGEMDTSLSNGFSNLMLFLYLCWKNGLRVYDTAAGKSQVRGFVEGDDGIFALDHHLLAPTQEQFSELGFTIKIGVTEHFNEASFCGQVYSDDDNVVITDIVDALCRFGWTNKKYVNASEKTRMELLRAKGFSLLYQYNGCPVLGCLGNRILQLTDECVVSQRVIEGQDLWHRERLQQAIAAIGEQRPEVLTPKLSTRQLVEKLFKVPVDTQLKWEKLINESTLGPISLPGLNVPDDWADYGSRYQNSTNIEPIWMLKNSLAYKARLVAACPQLAKTRDWSGVRLYELPI